MIKLYSETTHEKNKIMSYLLLFFMIRDTRYIYMINIYIYIYIKESRCFIPPHSTGSWL